MTEPLPTTTIEDLERLHGAYRETWAARERDPKNQELRREALDAYDRLHPRAWEALPALLAAARRVTELERELDAFETVLAKTLHTKMPGPSEPLAYFGWRGVEIGQFNQITAYEFAMAIRQRAREVARHNASSSEAEGGGR